MKTVYICGDSFGYRDPAYTGKSWHEKLELKLANVATVVNLSLVCASNLLIGLQVRRAISNNADFIICLGTSSLRDEATIGIDKTNLPLLDRFIDITIPNEDKKDLISYTFLNIDTPYMKPNKHLIKEYYSNLVSLDVMVHKNSCIIENTLQHLVDSKISFLFDQGGFEHSSYSNTKYFQKYQQYISEVNLWDHVTTRTKRPYFHLIDEQITDEIAKYYYLHIIDKFDK
jgi:hypothetical protein